MVETIIGGFIRLPKRSLIYILVCAGGILLFVGIGILPNQSVLTKLDDETSRVEFELQKQKALFPVFKKAMQILHDQKKEGVAVPKKSTEGLKDINSISPYFETIAIESGLHFKSGLPDVGKIKNSSGVIPFTLIVAGNYFDFRIFLMNLAADPHLDHIETIEVAAGSGMKEYRLRMNLLTGNGAAKK